jgi:hypothetical protein
MTFIEAYQALVKAFIEDRGLDYDDTFWTQDDRIAFKDAYDKLLIAYDRTPF